MSENINNQLIEKYNKIIAKYMGAIVIVNFENHDLVDYVKKEKYPEYTRYYASNTLKYNLSWSWLMPVIIQIQKSGLSYTMVQPYDLESEFIVVAKFILWIETQNNEWSNTES